MIKKRETSTPIMTYISKIRAALLTAFLALTLASLALPSSSEAAVTPQTSTAVQVVPAAVTQIVTKKASVRSYAAMHKAKTQAGKWYSWGAAGPSSYDCSGLVMWAYKQAGKSLPHNTMAMIRSGKLTRISKAEVRWGDLVFWGSDFHHVELFGHWTNKARTSGVTFGAHKSGTRISYRSFNGYYSPSAYFRVK